LARGENKPQKQGNKSIKVYSEKLQRFGIIIKEMLKQPIGAIGFVLLIVLVGTAIITPYLVPKDAYENWNSPEYWKDNPKLALPSWAGALQGIKYSKTSVYEISSEEAHVYKKYGAHVISFEITETYDYDWPFTGMILYLYFAGNATASVEVDIYRPDNITVAASGLMASGNGTRFDLKGALQNDIVKFVQSMNRYLSLETNIVRSVELTFSEWPRAGTIMELMTSKIPAALRALQENVTNNALIAQWDGGKTLNQINNGINTVLDKLSDVSTAKTARDVQKIIGISESIFSRQVLEKLEEISDFAKDQLASGNVSSENKAVYEEVVNLYNRAHNLLGLMDEVFNTIRFVPNYKQLSAEEILSRNVIDVEKLLVLGNFKGLKGEYTINVTITSTAPLNFTGAKIILQGKSHGLMGTDDSGRDLWYGLIWGVRIALIVGALTSTVSAVVGLFYGSVSGYLGGFVDEAMQRVIEVFVNIPLLPIMIAIGYSRQGLSYWIVALLLAVFGWAGIARVVRSMALQMREATFVEAARCLGASTTRVLFKHIMPQMLPYIFTTMAFNVPGAIISEASLSFLGVGDKVHPTWGKILSDAQTSSAAVNNYWWWVIPPGIGIMIIGLTFVFIGMSLDRVLNPRLRRL